jgi:hypothetical protein
MKLEDRKNDIFIRVISEITDYGTVEFDMDDGSFRSYDLSCFSESTTPPKAGLLAVVIWDDDLGFIGRVSDEAL